MYTREQAELCGQLGLEVFQKRNRELLASFVGAQVIKALVAYTRLHKQKEILTHVTTSDADLNFFADHLEEAFLTLYDEGKLHPEAPVTDLGQAALDAMRRRTGIYPNGEAPTLESKPLSAEEQLEARVVSDFERLPIKIFKQNCGNDRQYRETYERLAAENRLGASLVTSAVIAGA